MHQNHPSDMVDFFAPLVEEDSEMRTPLNLVFDIYGYHSLSEQYTIEEVYAKLILVSRDLALTRREIALWWVTLELYGLDDSLEITTLLYCTAYAAKERIGCTDLLDQIFVERNFVENFRRIYSKWFLSININRAIASANSFHFEVVPAWLHKEINYNGVVQFLTSEDSFLESLNENKKKNASPQLLVSESKLEKVSSIESSGFSSRETCCADSSLDNRSMGSYEMDQASLQSASSFLLDLEPFMESEQDLVVVQDNDFFL
mmetsp:Transcript_18167/g.20641  ORF Transcript_18167/g.20641 Transcript_18167/m.20641 type:complete len:261 (-) Transcript_18167:1419-2201(-)